MASTTGLTTGDFDDISIANNISLGNTENDGTSGQVIVSSGPNQPVEWGHAGGLSNALTAGTNLSLASGNSSWDATIADTINASDTTYQGSTTINIDTATNPDTINCIKVPNALTAGANISFSSGTTYDGSAAITINSTDTDTQLNLTAGDGIVISNTGGLNRTISAKPDEDTIDFDGTELAVIKVPEGLSAGTNLSYSSGSTFDGETARTINLDSAPTNLNLTDITNYVCPYLVFDVYDPSSLDSDSLSTSYVQIFSGNLSNSFTAKTTSVEVQLQIFHAASSSNRWLYLRLSDGGGNEWSSGTGTGGGYGTGTRSTERLVSYPDENDKRQMVMSWYLQGLTIGNSYTINPFAKTSSSWNYIYAGGSYPPCILKVINIPDAPGGGGGGA